MLFNSFEFLFAFLPVALAGFFLLARVSRLAAAGWLAAASLWFYGWWDPRYVVLLAASIALNFVWGRRLARRAGSAPRRELAVAVAANLVTLGIFKYADFAVANVNRWFDTALPAPGLVLPLGISFYTFTQIAFLVDAARGQAREYRALHYVLFVTWFPHLIAGPVLHHRQLMPQFDRASVYRWSSSDTARGLLLFTLGLAKKLLLADALAPLVWPAFDTAARGAPLAAGTAWVAALAYTFQLYFDFSGYSDMAVGLSKMFGVDLPINFNSPYKAANIADFWRRWHMTLSAFLRDYLYVPLGGNRRGTARRYVNLLATMTLGGLWHGANWTFVVWGAYHGVLLAAYHGWRQRRGVAAAPSPVARLAGTGLTFALVVAGWVVFRADSLAAAGHMFTAMASGLPWSSPPSAVLTQRLAAAAIIAFLLPNSSQWPEWLTHHACAPGWAGVAARLALGPAGGAAVGVLFVACLARLTEVSSEFLYFQF
jgi:alginate O-acetyltransferase complex protein AlgI